MKILMTCQYYWPDNFLINEIAEYLAKKGHDITVLTGLPDYSTTKVPKEYKWGKRRKEIHNGVKIIRVPIIARHHGFIMRVVNYLSYFLNSSIYVRTHSFKEYDVVFAYQLAPILMMNPAMIIKRKYKKPMFTYVLDIWPDQMKVWNVNESNPLFKIVLKYSQKAYNSGDIVAITSRPFKKYLVNTCKVDKNKIVYLPQHSNKLEINKGAGKKNSKVTNFVFAGNIGNQQNIECLIKAVSLMKTKKDFLVNIYGDGTSFQKCVNYAKELEVDEKVKFYGRVPKEELNNIYSNMDAFLLTLCSEKEIGYVANTVPAKLQNYMSGGKPILAAIDGGAKEIIEESNCGKAVPAGDSIQFAKLLDGFVENKEKYKDYGKNAIKYFNENFEKKIVLEKLEEYLIDLTKKRSVLS